MRRQPPIIRCFVALCFGAGITLAAFEWRSPFPDSVVTLSAAPHISADTVLNYQHKQPSDPELDSQTSQVEPTRLEKLTRWLPPGNNVERTEVLAETSPVELVLSLDLRVLEVRVPGEEPVLYEVAVGQDDWQTPQGKFAVINKLENPAWQHPITRDEIAPGPENPLGTRWIGFWSDGQAQIGFHGTNQEELIGQAVSHGCVRMRNQDIEALYQQVGVGTSVEVKL